MVTLSYVDSGFETSSRFVAHLGAYQGLFRQLQSFRFLYIAAKDAYFQKAEERFRSLVKRLGRDPPLLPGAHEVGAPRVCRARYRRPGIPQ